MTDHVPARHERTALLVHAHSENDSFVAAMRDRLDETLRAIGYETVHSDLYADSFNPVLSPSDFENRKDPDRMVYALEQRHGYQTNSLAPDIGREIAKVQQADLIVFTFPLFWFGLPAILKGWIDRVFVSGPFYGGKSIYARGGMAGKLATAAFSLGGREDMFGDEGIHGELVDGFMRSFFQGTLGYVGMEVIEPFIAYHVPYLSNGARTIVLMELEKYVRSLDSAPRIHMPDLSNFGRRLEKI